nr:hypothetical protein GCM10020093_036640 [Planobispora longispora]
MVQAFQDEDPAAGAGEVGGGDQAVVAASDDHSVIAGTEHGDIQGETYGEPEGARGSEPGLPVRLGAEHAWRLDRRHARHPTPARPAVPQSPG